MARPKKIIQEEILVAVGEQRNLKQTIHPLTEHFNIGDLNTLRDKLNEIIKFINEI